MATSRAAERRQGRERELVSATRALFDERGLQDAPIEEVARTVGIARGLIYRVFSSKEELFVLTITDYLDELHDTLLDAIAGGTTPLERFERCCAAYAGFCQRYPAFLDCSLSLMHRPAGELREMVSESVWLRLGEGMAGCVDQLAAILRAGAAAGDFAVPDPDYTANVLWTQTLGTMHLARIRVGVRRVDGEPDLFSVDPDRVAASCVSAALATVGARVGAPVGARAQPPASTTS
jgi:AcrR family transcriptional regulator